MKSNDFSSFEDRICNLLVKGLSFIFTVGAKGNWDDIRSTSHAILILRGFINERQKEWLNGPANWLLSHLRKEEIINQSNTVFESWESEIWDTALAIRATLSAKTEFRKRLSPSLRWLLSIKEKSQNKTWHDEPWETAHALLALLEANQDTYLISQTIGESKIKEEDFIETIDWYVNLQDNFGKIITPHYTAFFLLIVNDVIDKFS